MRGLGNTSYSQPYCPHGSPLHYPRRFSKDKQLSQGSAAHASAQFTDARVMQVQPAKLQPLNCTSKKSLLTEP